MVCFTTVERGRGGSLRMNHSVLWLVLEVLRPSWTVTGNRLDRGPLPPRHDDILVRPIRLLLLLLLPVAAQLLHVHVDHVPDHLRAGRNQLPGKKAARETSRRYCLRSVKHFLRATIRWTIGGVQSRKHKQATHWGFRGARSWHVLTQPEEFRNHAQKDRVHTQEGGMSHPGWSGRRTHTIESCVLSAVAQLICMLEITEIR